MSLLKLVQNNEHSALLHRGTHGTCPGSRLWPFLSFLFNPYPAKVIFLKFSTT